MGKVSISGVGGAGGGSDECTATRAELLKGYTAITNDSDDEAFEGTLELTGDATDSQVLDKKTYYNKDVKIRRTGTMQNVGSVSVSLNAGGNYTIPGGYHNGTGKVTANTLASQTPGNASSGQMLTGYNGWVNGQRVNGNIPIQGADEAADRAWATNWSTWGGGEIFLGVRNGHYLNGVNWIRYNLTNYVAGNIKKGVNIGGVVGTWEGYVPIITDLYIRGNNVKNWGGVNTDRIIFDAGQMTITGSPTIRSADNINLVGFNYLNIQGYSIGMDLVYSISFANRSLGGITPGKRNGDYTVSIPLIAANVFGQLDLHLGNAHGAIYRIWLS